MDQFVTWVRTKDYPACQQLDSVVEFDVNHVSDDPAADFHFIEIIRITSEEAFKADMEMPVFHSLEKEFNKMADVIEEIKTDMVGDGYKSE